MNAEYEALGLPWSYGIPASSRHIDFAVKAANAFHDMEAEISNLKEENKKLKQRLDTSS